MRKLPFWCQKVLPLVYDGALSYYEAISKVVAKLNELISWSNGVDATVSAAGEAANEAEDKAIDALNAAERADGKATEAKTTANEAKSIAQGIAGDIPTKTSELTNDSGFITEADIPTKTSDLTNDSGFITSADVPTKTSELTNDSGFITDGDVPTKTSELTNDSNFITRNQVLSWPAVEDNMTTLQVMALALNRPGAALSWFKSGGCGYTPTQSANAEWVFHLNSKNESYTIYVYFTATNTKDGNMYLCDASGVWHKFLGRSDFYRVYSAPSSAVSCANNTWATITSCVAPPGNGRCLIVASVRFASNSTGLRWGIIASSNTGTSAISRELYDTRNALNGDYTVVRIAGCYTCVEGTTYYLRAKQTSGGSLDVDFSCMEIIRLPSDSYILN